MTRWLAFVAASFLVGCGAPAEELSQEDAALAWAAVSSATARGQSNLVNGRPPMGARADDITLALSLDCGGGGEVR